MARIRSVVWDWNGTLLDDVAIALTTIDTVLEEYGRPPLGDPDAYRSVFRFPIADYYEALGLGPGSGLFDAAAHRYMAVWRELSREAPLRDGARAALVGVRDRGLGQAVVSASSREDLAVQMAPHDLLGLLDAALGIEGIYAASKAHVAAEWVASLGERGIAPAEVLFVGDTDHDVEIAHELGAQAAVVRGGHAHAHEVSARRAGAVVLDGPLDVLALLDGCAD